MGGPQEAVATACHVSHPPERVPAPPLHVVRAVHEGPRRRRAGKRRRRLLQETHAVASRHPGRAAPAWGPATEATEPSVWEGGDDLGDSAFLPRCRPERIGVPAWARPLTRALGARLPIPRRREKLPSSVSSQIQGEPGASGSALERSCGRIPRGPAPSCWGRCRGPRLPTWAGASKSAWKMWLMYVDRSIVRAKVYF